MGTVPSLIFYFRYSGRDTGWNKRKPRDVDVQGHSIGCASNLSREIIVRRDAGFNLMSLQYNTLSLSSELFVSCAIKGRQHILTLPRTGFGAAWAGMLVFDSLVFCMTLYKSIVLPRPNWEGAFWTSHCAMVSFTGWQTCFQLRSDGRIVWQQTRLISVQPEKPHLFGKSDGSPSAVPMIFVLISAVSPLPRKPRHPHQHPWTISVQSNPS